MEALDLEQRLRQFATMAIQKAFVQHIRGDRRYVLARRATEAFWALVKSKVSKDVYDELRQAWLEVDSVDGALADLKSNVHYWQGFADGIRIARLDEAAVPPSSEKADGVDELHDIVVRFEDASRNGAVGRVQQGPGRAKGGRCGPSLMPSRQNEQPIG